jgi:hypothetical protein
MVRANIGQDDAGLLILVAAAIYRFEPMEGPLSDQQRVRGRLRQRNGHAWAVLRFIPAGAGNT